MQDKEEKIKWSWNRFFDDIFSFIPIFFLVYVMGIIMGALA